jgi:hypothetical protein
LVDKVENLVDKLYKTVDKVANSVDIPTIRSLKTLLCPKKDSLIDNMGILLEHGKLLLFYRQKNEDLPR